MNELRAGTPRVTVHYAQTLDGRIATRTGHSQWISGEASLHLAHRLRAEHDAVAVGVGTVLADDPRLTVRLVPGRSPYRIVLDSTTRLPLDATLLTDAAAPTIIATTARAPQERVAAVRQRGARTIVLSQDQQGRVSLPELLSRLGELGVGSLLIEGGGSVITSALRAGIVDRLVVCVAPKMIGAGIEAVGDLDIRHLGEALTFVESSFTPVGEDMIFDGQLTAVPAWSV